AITHDLLAAAIITDRANFIADGKIVATGTLDEVRHSDHPHVREFFQGSKAYAAA
ncbi:MAG: ABC transporter ATP-binding protein, partial [Bacteroidetes bacterium]|nr:ABC transporter ATP-binding protein [Bacteroidota bacterium]